MATVLQFRFPGRRYHATPWGSHVNEGQVEWPPSPWRILRALLSTGFTKLRWPADGPPEAARRLIGRLASLTPGFVLPPATAAHSRHYVDADGKKPLILDTWLRIDDGILEIVWDADLEVAERSLLSDLVEVVGYLGRAESWVEARLASVPQGRINCHPDADDGIPGPGWESVRVLCATSPEAYAAWRTAGIAPILESTAPAPGRRLSAAGTKKIAKALAPYPENLLEAICADTGVLQSQGWSAAPGSREVIYWRRSDSLSTSIHRRLHRIPQAPVPFALIALATPSRRTAGLPPLHRTFPQARLLHRAIASIIGNSFGHDPSLALVLLGRHEGGRAETDHNHAHLLPLDLGGVGRLDHVLVHAPMGLDGHAQDVLRHLRRTFMKGGAHELQTTLTALGDAMTLRTLPHPFSTAMERVLGRPDGSTSWRSATPYVAPRLLKKRGKDSLEGQVRLECERRRFPLPIRIDVATRDSSAHRPLRHYILHDKLHRPPWPAPISLHLHFETPINGPLCLGYGAHSGLGRFEATD
jgi:CRISPR-associated protein Csb2